MTPVLRPAQESELPALSELCRASKAVWGYDAEFMDLCYDELTIDTSYLPDLIVAELAGQAIGVAAVRSNGQTARLESFFVAPRNIGTGIGRLLFDWAVSEATARGASHMTITSDPGAMTFYERMGATVSGSTPSGSIPGRVLPVMTMDLLTEAAL